MNKRVCYARDLARRNLTDEQSRGLKPAAQIGVWLAKSDTRANKLNSLLKNVCQGRSQAASGCRRHTRDVDFSSGAIGGKEAKSKLRRVTLVALVLCLVKGIESSQNHYVRTIKSGYHPSA